MKLCKSHITQLRKVSTALAYKQKMNGTQLVLGAENSDKLFDAEMLISKAMTILNSIE